ncbi:MAG: tyrosine-type recombinase/integrase [Lewinellaceae bacterium]|nr:tyrosine-type recombinase/integrase [Lewinellaceae bacterium]MCB9039662.1 tyrosine-type recombinase/integrase [Lewinellaceae bacterium]
MANHLTVAGLAKSTALNYVRSLRDVQERAGKPADELTRDELLAYLAARRKHLSASTLNTVVCALKYYYREVARRLELVVDIPNPRKPKQLGDLLNADELRLFLGAARSMRHRLVLELLFGLGLRAGEVGRLRISDFNREQGTVTIRTSKGGITRVLPYGGRLRDTLNQYYRQERPKDFLIPGRERSSSQGISLRGVQYITSTTLQRSRLHKKVCPHTLRHCFAVHYLNNGGNLVRLQQLLGHAYLSTTLLYLRYASITLRDIPSPLDFLSDEHKG